MRVNRENKVIKPNWLGEDEWGELTHLQRLKLLRDYSEDVTSLSLLKDIRSEIYYYESIQRQIRELTK